MSILGKSLNNLGRLANLRKRTKNLLYMSSDTLKDACLLFSRHKMVKNI